MGEDLVQEKMKRVPPAVLRDGEVMIRRPAVSQARKSMLRTCSRASRKSHHGVYDTFPLKSV